MARILVHTTCGREHPIRAALGSIVAKTVVAAALLSLAACTPKPTASTTAAAASNASTQIAMSTPSPSGLPSRTPAPTATPGPSLPAAPTSTLAPSRTPTNTPLPTTTSTLAPVGEIQPIPKGWVYLGGREALALGFNMDAGGAIGSLLFDGHELVDHTDYGRYIQLSFYDGHDSYRPLGNDPYGDWGWNPVQAGSKAGGSSIIGAKVLEYRTAEGSIYIKALGKEWGQHDQDSDVIFETWAWQREGHFEVRTRATHTGADTHALAAQEFPAAYFATTLTHEFGYFGDVPFTGAPIEELHQAAREGEIAGQGNCLSANPTENWAAFGTSDRFGLILAVPSQDYLQAKWGLCLLYDRPPVGYIAPSAYFDVPPHAVREITYYLIPGPIESARALVYDLIPHTTWTFNLNTAEGWHTGGPALGFSKGVMTAYLSPDDWLASPDALLFAGLAAPTISLHARTQGSQATICLRFRTVGDADWDAGKSACLPISPGDLQTYVYRLGENPDWNGKMIAQLRLAASLPVWLEIDSLEVNRSGYAWEFEVAGHKEGWVAWHQLDTLQVNDGYLFTHATGSDPYMSSPSGLSIDAASQTTIQIRMSVSAGSGSELFFITDTDREFDGAKSLSFQPIADGQFYTYTLDVSKVAKWRGVITQVRLDPTDRASAIKVDYIRVMGIP